MSLEQTALINSSDKKGANFRMSECRNGFAGLNKLVVQWVRRALNDLRIDFKFLAEGFGKRGLFGCRPMESIQLMRVPLLAVIVCKHSPR